MVELVDYSETIPIQYEQGYADFMETKVKVDPRVLIPRPETVLLVETSLSIIADKGMNNSRLLDIGTGSGIIPISILKRDPSCSFIACDISEDAIEVAKMNLSDNFLNEKVELVVSDVFSGIEKRKNFDGIISNPPYVSDKDYELVDAWVKAEPEVALKGGLEGLNVYKLIIAESKEFLKEKGFLAFEVGYDQAGKVKDMMAASGFKKIKGYFDINGHERVITGING